MDFLRVLGSETVNFEGVTGIFVGLIVLLLFTEELRVKVDGKSAPDQKANTPRSKHSATEQRRRSKINDRHV